MNGPTQSPRSSRRPRQLRLIQEEFLRALPRIRRHARIAFRDVRCFPTREDRIAEAEALAWKWWLRLRERGKDPTAFVSTLAVLACRAVRSGRRLCGQERARDVHSARAQQRHQFRLAVYPHHTQRSYEDRHRPQGQRIGDAYEEWLQDNRQTPVPEQVAFRCDFPVWLARWDDRRRALLACMMLNESTSSLAAQFQVSQARISQLRREFRESWQLYAGEVEV
jgi:hypothetical protein